MYKRYQHVDSSGRTNVRRPSRLRNNRRGQSMMEMIVSAVIICATVTTITTMLFKCGVILRDVSRYRVAVRELSSNLEELTLLDVDSATEKNKHLKPSQICEDRLPEAKLTGTLVEDNLGVRVELSLNWKHVIESKPVVLCGWLIESEDSE